MLLSPRTAMMSLIVVSVAVLAKLPAASVVEAREASDQPRSPASAPTLLRQSSVAQARHWNNASFQRQQQLHSGPVSRRVLMIGLAPVIDFEALSGERYASQTPYDSEPLVPLDPAGMSPARRWHESVQAIEQSSTVRSSMVGSPLAAALAPRPGELEPDHLGETGQSLAEASQPIARLSNHKQSHPRALHHWDAPFPSLGQPRLDRQLRRYLAYLETVGQPDILIVGGQGAAQGIDPGVLQSALGDRGYGDLKVFNWGLSDSSAQTVEWLLTELLTPQQLPQLVIWADNSVALNGGRSDSAFDRIEASPGYRFLARGLRPSLSEQEKALVERLQKILSYPIARELPDEMLALAQSPLGGAVSSSAHPAPRPSEMPVGMETKQNQKRESLPETAAQSDGTGFRLVNWCRHSNGPCLPAEDQLTAQPAIPDWLRQSQAAQEAAARRQQTFLRTPENSLQTQQTPGFVGASTIGAATVDTLTVGAALRPEAGQQLADKIALPAWPQSQGAQDFARALGFQPVGQRLGTYLANQPKPLRGEQDRDYRNFSLQGEQNRALHRLMQFSQRQEMAIAFVQLPLSQHYLDIERHSREQSFQTYLNVATQMTSLRHLDLSGEGESWNDAFFAQPHRLNRYGAAVLSWQIGQALDVSLLKGLR